MAARLSLKDQLAQLDQPAPIDLDPEDAFAGESSEHRLDIDHSAAREHYIDVAPSTLRKLHESVSDPKYEGIRTSRHQLYDQTDDEESVDDDDENADEDELENHGDDFSDEMTEDDEELDSPDGSADEESGSASEAEAPQSGTRSRQQSSEASASLARIDLGRRTSGPGQSESAEAQPEGDIASNLRRTHEADKKKGQAVSRQITVYDTLLDARIQLQKALTAANRLPLPEECDEYVSHPHAREAIDSLLNVAGSLTEELFSLQEGLLRLNESIEAPARKRRKVDGSAAADGLESGAVMEELCGYASALEESYHPWVVDTLSKWSAKVQAVAPNVLLPDNRGSFMRDGRSSQVGVVSVIDDVLRTDGGKLLERTRKRKDRQGRLTESRAGGGEGDEGVAVEVFDDTDYYQQLLRDVIAARGGSGEQGGEQEWQGQQRERKAKRKKTVDTKASKGRKLRYEVHAKLQNFMVPVPVVGGDWHEEQIDGLFSSLLQS